MRTCSFTWGRIMTIRGPQYDADPTMAVPEPY